MRVQDILRAKNAKLVVISPDISVRQAAAMIADEQVGMLLVVDARRVLIGLLSERDIVRFIAARGNDALASGVSAAMVEIGLMASPRRFRGGRDAADDEPACAPRAGDIGTPARRRHQHRRHSQFPPR
jgi:CBS domain-containing protein